MCININHVMCFMAFGLNCSIRFKDRDNTGIKLSSVLEFSLSWDLKENIYRYTICLVKFLWWISTNETTTKCMKRREKERKKNRKHLLPSNGYDMSSRFPSWNARNWNFTLIWNYLLEVINRSHDNGVAARRKGNMINYVEE